MTFRIRATCGAVSPLAGLGTAVPASAEGARQTDARQTDVRREATPARAPRQADVDALTPAPGDGRAPVGAIFGTERARSHPVPAKGGDLADGVQWQVDAHASGRKRDLSATRFDAARGRWTGSRLMSSALAHARGLGFRRLLILCDADDLAMRRLAARFGLRLAVAEGEAFGWLDVDGPGDAGDHEVCGAQAAAAPLTGDGRLVSEASA